MHRSRVVTHSLAGGLALLLCGCVSVTAPLTRVEVQDLRPRGVQRAVAPVGIRDDDDALTRRTIGELHEFTSWLDEFGQPGSIGEVGWPGARGGDGQKWNALARRWYAAAEQQPLWIATPGSPVGSGRHLSVYPTSGRNAIDHRGSQAADTEQWPGTSRHERGINLADGAAITQQTAFSNEAHGRYGRDYRYPAPASFAYLADRGVDFVRIAIRWERIQPTLFDPLDRAELRRLHRAVDAAGGAGLHVVIDLHNFGGYRMAGPQGIRRLTIGSDRLPATALIDVWRRLSAEFADHVAVVAYGLMHGPDGLSVTSAAARRRYTWDTDIQGWEAPAGLDTRVSRSGTGSLRLPWPRGATSLFVSDGRGARRDCSRYGALLSVWIHLPPDADVGRYTAALQVQDTAYEYHGGEHVALRPGRWTQVRYSVPAGVLGACRAIALHLTGPGQPADNDIAVNVDDLTQRGRLLPAQVWEAASQAVVSALRDHGDDTIMLVGGHGRSMVRTWREQHPRPWIIDASGRFRYEAHHYWNKGRRASYDSYKAELAAAAADISGRTSADGR